MYQSSSLRSGAPLTWRTSVSSTLTASKSETRIRRCVIAGPTLEYLLLTDIVSKLLVLKCVMSTACFKIHLVLENGVVVW